jgi:hypothetical protein
MVKKMMRARSRKIQLKGVKERMVFLLVGARNTMAALLNLEDGGEDDERKIEIFKD